METIVDNSSVKLYEDNKFCYIPTKHSKIKTENTNWAVSVYEEKLSFCKNAQSTLTCSVEMLSRLVAISGQISEVNLNNFQSDGSPDE